MSDRNTPLLTTEIVVFKPAHNGSEFQVLLDGSNDTVWLSQQQMTELFQTTKQNISLHIKNIYKEGELEENSTFKDYLTVQREGKRMVSRRRKHYNLDVIISVGYRIKSTIGVQFRKWATQRLKEYLLKGYSLNLSILEQQKNKITQLHQEIDRLSHQVQITQQQLTDGLLSIITHYSKSFELLNQYDSETLSVDHLNSDFIYTINYSDVKKAIESLKQKLIQKGEASELFGNEKDDSFAGILGSISQTIFGKLAYPSIEEQAAQLLYSIIKGHAFSDGNKRIGSFIFVWFLEQNQFHLTADNRRKINDNTLVALALAVAQSLPDQRNIMVKLIINLIKNN